MHVRGHGRGIAEGGSCCCPQGISLPAGIDQAAPIAQLLPNRLIAVIAASQGNGKGLKGPPDTLKKTGDILGLLRMIQLTRPVNVIVPIIAAGCQLERVDRIN